MFSGDHIYVDRLLGVLPQSNASKWLDAFNQIEFINPKVIVPGHGAICDLSKAKRHESPSEVMVAALGALYKRASSPNASPGSYFFNHFDTIHSGHLII